MKRYMLSLLVLAMLALSLLAVNAGAVTGYGSVVYTGGGACAGCNVNIHNGTTGANGSTVTNGSGTYVVNMNNANQYTFSIGTCKVHSWYYSGWSAYVNGNQSFLPSLTAYPGGAC